MDLRNFYPEVYLKAGATGLTATTQDTITTELGSWLHVSAAEAGAKIEETAGLQVKYTNGKNKQVSIMVDGAITFLQCTVANYNWLRATYHRKVTSVVMNEVYKDGSGRVVSISGIIPSIMMENKTGDICRIKIAFKKEVNPADKDLEIYDVIKSNEG